MRIHPAIIAHAAATAACLMPGRFFLGVGTGENLNEHVLGQRWPEWDVRVEMLEEAVEIIRELWRGEVTSHRGRHYEVQNARIFTLPDEPPPIHVAASGQRMAERAGRIGDGLIGTSPDPGLVEAYRDHGGDGPRFGQMTMCWARSEAEARRTAHRWWPTAGLQGEVTQELPNPAQFTELVGIVTEDQVAAAITCGPDAEVHLARIRAYLDAGFDHVYLHQVGPDQDGFLDFARRDLLPTVSALEARDQAVAVSSSA
jgi:G6PDH family F420-dependent oxidoreductase